MNATIHVELRNVTKLYGGGGWDAVGVKDVSLNLHPGEVHAILGPNGAGKSTLARIICGTMMPTSGGVYYDNRNLFDLSHAEQVSIRRKIGYLPESPFAYDMLTGREYLLFIAEVYGVGSALAKEQVEHYIGMFDLQTDAHRFVRAYSQGQLKKLALIATLIVDPQLIVLDEPTNGLDPRASVRFREVLLEQRVMGRTVVISSHNLDIVEGVCDRVWIMKNGLLAHMQEVDPLRGHAKQDGRSALERLYFEVTS